MVEYNDVFSFKRFIDCFNDCLTKELNSCFININASDCMAYIKIRCSEVVFYLLLCRTLVCEEDLEFSFKYSCFDMTDELNTKQIFEVYFDIDKDCYFRKECFDNSYEECSSQLSDYILNCLDSNYNESYYRRRKKNINELLKGRIGSVNATRKDAVKIIDYLEKYFNKSYESIGFENRSKDDGFSIFGNFVYTEKTWDEKNKEYKYKKPQFYQLKIYETPWNKSDKICIELVCNKKFVDITKGLILDGKKICLEIEKILEDNNIDQNEILSPKEFEKEQESRKNKEEKDRIEKEKRRQRDSELKRMRDYEDEKEKDRRSKAQKDWFSKHGDEFGFKSVERI